MTELVEFFDYVQISEKVEKVGGEERKGLEREREEGAYTDKMFLRCFLRRGRGTRGRERVSE